MLPSAAPVVTSRWCRWSQSCLSAPVWRTVAPTVNAGSWEPTATCTPAASARLVWSRMKKSNHPPLSALTLHALFFFFLFFFAGWKGWGCTDYSSALSYGRQLLSTLLLTLSNLSFLPAIVVATRRFYITEASVYCFTMFFSTVTCCHAWHSKLGSTENIRFYFLFINYQI